MAIQISGTTVVDNARQILSATGAVVTGGAGIVTATKFSGDGSLLTGVTASAFAAGTVLLFYQAAAPTGWTQVTTQNNKALRVVSTAGGGTGGTTAFTSVFASRTPAGTVTINNAAVTLSTAQIPSHSHSATIFNGSAAAGVHFGFANQKTIGTINTDATGDGGSHTHSNTASFTGTALDFAVQYIDVIIASKN